jgi:hypothetical protein
MVVIQHHAVLTTNTATHPPTHPRARAYTLARTRIILSRLLSWHHAGPTRNNDDDDDASCWRTARQSVTDCVTVCAARGNILLSAAHKARLPDMSDIIRGSLLTLLSASDTTCVPEADLVWKLAKQFDLSQ